MNTTSPTQNALSELSVIGARLRTQDNRGTSNPMFCVQEKKRDYGLDPQWVDNFVWVDPEEYFEVEAGTPGAIKTGYKDHWETVMVAFTEAGCEEYLKLNGHNHRGEMRIYVESWNRCPEMVAIRSALLEAPSAHPDVDPPRQNARLAALVRKRIETLAHDLDEEGWGNAPGWEKAWRMEAVALERVILEFPSVGRGNDQQPATPVIPESSSVPPASKAEDAETIQNLIEQTARELVSQVGADSWSETQGILRKFAEALVKPDTPSDRVEHVKPWKVQEGSDDISIKNSAGRIMLFASDKDRYRGSFCDIVDNHNYDIGEVGRGPVNHLADQVRKLLHHWKEAQEALSDIAQLLSDQRDVEGETELEEEKADLEEKH